MKILGVTGPTGSGKSSLSKVAENLGFCVIDADKISREVTLTEFLLLKELAIAFGNEIIEGGTLNRKELARRAFKTPESKLRLERIIFPYIKRKIAKNIEKAKNEGYSALLLDAPTLFESGLQNICDKTLAVLAREDIRRERIISRDNLSEKDAEVRLSAAASDEFFTTRADIVLHNNTTHAQFELECEKVLKAFLNDKSFKED